MILNIKGSNKSEIFIVLKKYLGNLFEAKSKL